jgi:hypothetical protein
VTAGDVGQVSAGRRRDKPLVQPDDDEARPRMESEQVRNQLDQIPGVANAE